MRKGSNLQNITESPVWQAADIEVELLRLQRLSALCQIESKTFVLPVEFKGKLELVTEAVRCLGPYSKVNILC